MNAPVLEVEVWSDVVCPWCYVGKRRLEAALARFPHKEQVRLTWRSFELDASAPRSYAGQGTYAERLARKYGTDVPQAQGMLDRMTAVAAEEGLTFDFGKARPGNTFDAHRLLHLAAERGVQDRLKERLVRACFTEGQPIADVDTLVALAAEAGLPAEEARAVLAGDRYADAVRADEARARQLGISGVPFFVLGNRYGVSGAQPAEVLLQALQQAWDETVAVRPLPLAGAVPQGESCGPDGC
jgi:predicted DsbA family dithiol-disulfide isomerase